MKKVFMLISILSINLVSFAQIPSNYISPKFKELATNHQELAVLPFDFRLELASDNYELIDFEKLRKLELTESMEVQKSIHQYLLDRKAKKRFKVSFQPIKQTNQLLEANNISHENIAQYTRKQLIDILGVDGIVYGSITAAQVISESDAILYGFFSGYFPDTYSNNMTIKVADADQGEVIWDYYTTQGGGFDRTQVSLVRNMLKRAARRFPYKRL